MFSGWYTINDEDSKEMTNEMIARVMGNHSIYALWTTNTYTTILDFGNRTRKEVKHKYNSAIK